MRGRHERRCQGQDRGVPVVVLPVDDLKDDDDIFQLGIVTSIFAIQLVAFVEQEFDITVEKEDLEIEYFRSINALDSFVSRKLPPAA